MNNPDGKLTVTFPDIPDNIEDLISEAETNILAREIESILLKKYIIGCDSPLIDRIKELIRSRGFYD